MKREILNDKREVMDERNRVAARLVCGVDRVLGFDSTAVTFISTPLESLT